MLPLVIRHLICEGLTPSPLPRGTASRGTGDGMKPLREVYA